MLRPYWLVLNKKTSLIVLLIVPLLLLAFWGYRNATSYNEMGKKPPREILTIGLDRTMASESFRYQSEIKLVTEGKVNIDYFSKVAGARAAPDQVQIKGTIMNTPVEFIQAGDSAYFKDQTSGRWITLAGNNPSGMENFYAELNPLVYFNFKDIPEIMYKGVTTLNGEKLLYMEIRPILSDPLLELRLTDFFFKIWLNTEDYRIHQALIQTREKNNPKSEIEIDLSFWDYDKNISINPPDVN